MDEIEAIKLALNRELVEVREVNGLYVVRVEECSPFEVRAAKKYLKKMGFGSLARKVVFECS